MVANGTDPTSVSGKAPTVDETTDRLDHPVTTEANGRSCELFLAAREVVVQHALGRLRGQQQLGQANAVQATSAQGVGHGGDEAVAGGLEGRRGRHAGHCLDRSV